mgnify:CR=1 FL=1
MLPRKGQRQAITQLLCLKHSQLKQTRDRKWIRKAEQRLQQKGENTELNKKILSEGIGNISSLNSRCLVLRRLGSQYKPLCLDNSVVSEVHISSALVTFHVSFAFVLVVPFLFHKRWFLIQCFI